MATYKYLVLFAFIIYQGARGMPATAPSVSSSPSYGTQFQTDFNKNLAQVMNNMYTGSSTLASNPIKFGFDTLPNLLQQGLSTATDKVNKITAAGKEGLQKLGMGAGHAIGGGGVLGSSIAGGAMQVAGHGLGVGVDIVDAGSKAGIDFLGHIGDNAASGISVGTTIGSDALSTLGNGMIAAGTGVNIMSTGLATLLDVIGSRLSTSINKSEQIIAGLMDAGVLKLENGALSFSSTAQANIYNILNSFLQILVNVQKLFDGLRLNINTGVTTPGISGAVSGAANTGTRKVSGGVSGTVGGTTTGQTTKSVTGASASTKSTRGLIDPETEESQTEIYPETDILQTEQIETAESESAEPTLLTLKMEKSKTMD